MLETQINTAIKEAMLAKDSNTLTALRSIKASFQVLNASGKEITEDMRLKSLQTMVKQRSESAELFKQNNRMDLHETEMFQISVIERFLPKQLSAEEIEAEVKAAITETGATSAREMGKVIGLVSKKLVGKAEGKVISDITKKLLA